MEGRKTEGLRAAAIERGGLQEKRGGEKAALKGHGLEKGMNAEFQCGEEHKWRRGGKKIKNYGKVCRRRHEVKREENQKFEREKVPLCDRLRAAMKERVYVKWIPQKITKGVHQKVRANQNGIIC